MVGVSGLIGAKGGKDFSLPEGKEANRLFSIGHGTSHPQDTTEPDG
jgi:hypothetical protein